jgi:hypothetical protein
LREFSLLACFLLAFVLYLLQSCKSIFSNFVKKFASSRVLDVSAGRNLVLVHRKREQGVRRKSVGSSTFPRIILREVKFLITPGRQGNRPACDISLKCMQAQAEALRAKRAALKQYA